MSRISESRRNKRKPFDHVALLDFCDGEDPRPCQIQDISEGGARVQVFADLENIPETFKLLLSPSAKVTRSCKVAWRSANELGVRFLKSAD